MKSELEVRQHLQQRLASGQLPEGGWPYTQSSTQAALEPSCLTLLALRSETGRTRDLALRFLLQAQGHDGSWPAVAGAGSEGSGLSGLALFALDRCGICGQAIDRGFEWLLHLRGWESHWLWRWKFKTSDRHVGFDPDKFGWPWMPETASWVAPTAYSLLALKQSFVTSPAELARFRIRRGVAMLFDRACPQGGWNAGNAKVYGQPLPPHLDTTALALLALQDDPANALVTASLDWLELRAQTCFSPWSLAWAILALDVLGRPTCQLALRLAHDSGLEQIRDHTSLAAASLALDCASQHNVFKVPA